MMRRITALVLLLTLSALCLLPAAAPAEEETRVVRVAWYESPFTRRDALGRRTGYTYEYARKIAAYTGWKYEYVEGTWQELLQMLRDGRIDLMGDVSYTEERAQEMFYSGLPMGEELYYLYVAPENTVISGEDISSLNGKKIGVSTDSLQREMLLSWVASHRLSAEVVDLPLTEAQSLQRLKAGEIDAFVTLNYYEDPETAVPLYKIGSSEFFFAVSKKRPDLLAELDAALSRIQTENKHYNEQLSEKYLYNFDASQYLTAEETAWLEHHGPIRVGFQDHYLAFCAADPETGELTGALKDYLSLASDTLGNAHPEFEAIVYPTAADAMEALKKGEIDCMFPANLTDYDAETTGVVMSPPIMRSEMDAVIRAEDQQTFFRKSQVRVGVNQGNPNYELFLTEHYPGWTAVLFPDTPACLREIARKSIDCVIISNYRYGDISALCNQLGLTTLPTGVNMDYCFAVRQGDTTLYSILARIICQMPEASINASLAYYATEQDRTPGFLESLLHNTATQVFAGTTVLAVLLLIIVLLRTRKKPGKSPEKS